MNKKTKFTFLLLCFVLININAQKYVFVKLTLEGKKFDSLRIATKDTTNKLAIFACPRGYITIPCTKGRAGRWDMLSHHFVL